GRQNRRARQGKNRGKYWPCEPSSDPIRSYAVGFSHFEPKSLSGECLPQSMTTQVRGRSRGSCVTQSVTDPLEPTPLIRRQIGVLFDRPENANCVTPTNVTAV